MKDLVAIDVACKLAGMGLGMRKMKSLFSSQSFVILHLKKFNLFNIGRDKPRSGLSYIGRNALNGEAAGNFLDLYVKLSGVKVLPLRDIDTESFYKAFVAYDRYFPDCPFVDVNTALSYVEALVSGKINQNICVSSCNRVFFAIETDMKKSCPSCRLEKKALKKIPQTDMLCSEVVRAA